MWELDSKESWAPKNWCFWTVVLEKTLQSPLECKEIQPVHPKGDQSWIVIGRIDAETLILWPPDTKNWLPLKDPDAGRDWGQEEKGTTEDEMAGWHHWLDGRKSEWTLGVGNRQGGLACCDSWGRKELDTTERLNWTDTHNDPDRLNRWVYLCIIENILHVNNDCIWGCQIRFWKLHEKSGILYFFLCIPLYSVNCFIADSLPI